MLTLSTLTSAPKTRKMTMESTTLVRVHLDCLAQFALFCEDLETGEQEWGEYGMDTPDYVFYTDTHYSNIESKEMFLSSPDGNVKRTTSVTELDYMENFALSNAPGYA